MSLDVQQLQQELQSIDQERIHVSERLRTIGGRGRPMFPGRGMAPGMGRPAISPRDAHADGPFTNGFGAGPGPRGNQNGGFRNLPPAPGPVRQGDLRERLGDPRDRGGVLRDRLGDVKDRPWVPPYAPGARGLPPPPPPRGLDRDRRGDPRGDPRGDYRGDPRGESRGDPRGDSRGQPRGDFRGDHRGDPRRDGQGDPRRDPRGEAHGDPRDRGLDRGEDRQQGPGDRRPYDDEGDKSGMKDAAPPETNKRKRLASAVVMDGEQRIAQQGYENDAPGIAKRPKLEEEDKPEVKQRNRRLFGALMGTLEAFKKEDKQFASSKAAILREEALKRAEKRKAEEAALARQQERINLNKQMQAEVVRKRELNAAAAAKRLQIMVALRILHHEKLSKFLRTEVGPRLMWQPKVHCPETLALLDARAADFVAFKARELAKMETDSQRLLDLAKPPALRAGYVAPHKAPEGGEAKANGGRAEEEGEEDEAEDREGSEDDEGGREGSEAEDMETDKDGADEDRNNEKHREEHEERRAGMGPAEHAGGDRWQADAKSEGDADADTDADLEDPDAADDADAVDRPPAPPASKSDSKAGSPMRVDAAAADPAEPATASPADPTQVADARARAEGGADAPPAEGVDVEMAEAGGEGGDVRKKTGGREGEEKEGAAEGEAEVEDLLA